MTRPPIVCFCFLALLVALLPLGLNRAAAQTHAADAALASPLRGTLPNGVSYVVVPHASPRAELSVRLVVRAGALDEARGEQGFAHLLQHLLIDQAGRLASPKLRTFLQRFPAVASHAEPSHTHATYAIDLPIGGAPQVDEVLAVLSRMVGEPAFTTADVERVLPTVALELQPPTAPHARLAERFDATLYAGTRIAERHANAANDLPQRATPEKLEAFFRRNYFPHGMTVAVVGPVEAQSAAEKIARSFGELASAPNAPRSPRADEFPSVQEIKPSVFALPGAPARYGLVEITSIRARPEDTPAGRRLEFNQAVAVSALNARLNTARSHARVATSRLPSEEEIVERIMERARINFPDPQTQVLIAGPGQSPQLLMEQELTRQQAERAAGSTPQPVVIYKMPTLPPVLTDSGGATRATTSIAPGGKWLRHSVRLTALDGAWEWLLELAEAELRRLRRDGFSSEECAAATARELTAARDRIHRFRSSASENLADDIAEVVGESRVWRSPADHLAEAQSAHPTKAEIDAALAELFPGDALHVILFVGEKQSFDPDKLLALYSKSAKAPLPGREFPPLPSLQFDATTRPIAPARATQLSDLDLTLASFPNGVRVNFRPAKSEDKRFRMCMVFGGNWSDSPAKVPGLTPAAAFALLGGPFRQRGSLKEFLAEHEVHARFVVEAGVPVLHLDAPVDRLEFVFHVLHWRFAGVSWDDRLWQSVIADHLAAEKQKAVSAELFAFQSALRRLVGGDERIALLPSLRVDRAALEGETASWLRKHILDGPLEIGVVGDLEPERVLKAAEVSFARLKKRSAPKSGAPLKMNQQGSHRDELAPFPSHLGVACALWPVPLGATPREEAALILANEILRARMAAVLRAVADAGNSIDVSLHRDPAQPGLAFVRLLMFFPPAALKQFAAGSLQLAARLAEKGIAVEELEAARAAAIARLTAEQADDGWWVRHVVAVAQSHPSALATARERRAHLENIALDEVNAAARLFTRERATLVELRPPPPRRSETKAPAK